MTGQAPLDQMAYAVPRVTPESGGAVPLPQPLNPSDAALVRQIFALQAKGQVDAAVQATARLSNRILLGRILADRYLSPQTRIAPAELQDWLAQYGTEADAPAILALLRTKLKGAALPATLASATALASLPAPDSSGNADLSLRSVDDGIDRQSGLDARVQSLTLAGRFDAAMAAIRSARIDPLYGATLRAEVARMAFARDRNQTAAFIAREAMDQAHGKLGLPAFIAGLSAWRSGQDKGPQGTLALFATAANAPSASPELVSAASFWAARAALRLNPSMDYLAWMRRAAGSGNGFYAVLAAHMLGRDGGEDAIGGQTLGLADLEALSGHPRAERAFALLQVGQTQAAEAEFRLLYPEISHDVALTRALMLVAWQAGMATFASQIASLDPKHSGPSPVIIPPLSLFPQHGVHVDPALLYALVRVESNFDAKAVSGVGARGLLQLMPATAAFMNGAPQGSKARSARLADPAYNLEVGQRYLNYLARQTDGDLLRILASYNAGPVKAGGWDNAEVAMRDPLLYIEMIPNPETRHFVASVLRYSWAYAAQLRLPVPSLDALADGHFPRMRATALVETPAVAGTPTIH